MTHTLSKEEYYDVVLKDVESHKPVHDISKTPPLALAIYYWTSDFTDRRGIRQTWDWEMSEEAQNTFLNESYQIMSVNLSKTEVNLDMMNDLITQLKTINNMDNEFDQIDDDIVEEIKTTWLDIFKTNLS